MKKILHIGSIVSALLNKGFPLQLHFKFLSLDSVERHFLKFPFSFHVPLGFGLLESGISSRKNEVNIMVKNAVDVVFGGLSFWMLGYGFSFGTDPGTNSFCGIGSFFLDPGRLDLYGMRSDTIQLFCCTILSFWRRKGVACV